MSGTVDHMPQQLTLDVDRPVAALLGVESALHAVRAIASGDVEQRHFDAVGDDWDIEARTTAALAEAGLPLDAADRSIGELSGGEAVLAALVGVRLRRSGHHAVGRADQQSRSGSPGSLSMTSSGLGAGR